MKQIVFYGLLVSLLSVFIGTASAAQQISWTTQANSLRGQNGEQVSYYCPAGGSYSGRLWGTDLYTDDSSICLAAVHAGLITPEQGGNVTIMIRPGAASYQSSQRNGVKSNSYGQWSGSFSFVQKRPTGYSKNADSLVVQKGRRPFSEVRVSEVKAISWTTQANSLRGQNGEQVSYYCPAGGSYSGRLWGTDLYTDDSSICLAAVHAGLITPEQGGNVTIMIRPGAASYQSSQRNGVKSNSYGQWSGSFSFVTR